ncbi:MAG: hypothetical protein WCR46_02695 [Deltaproteobacteria bacterium]
MQNKIDSRSPVNTDNNIALLVVSCDAYKDLWRPFFHCLFKYWPDCPYPIFLGSNKAEYSDPRVKSILVGPDKDYSSNLIAMLKHIDHPWVILWIEDFILSALIDTARLSKLMTDAQSRGAGYVKLIASFPYAYMKNRIEEIGIIPKGIKYRVNIGVTLFRKDVLVGLLRSGESAWDIEYKGAYRSEKIPEDFYSLNSSMKSNPPISYINAVGKGRWIRNSIPFLKKEGFGDCISNRKVQPLRSYIYYRLYLIRLEIYRRLRLYWYEKN